MKRSNPCSNRGWREVLVVAASVLGAACAGTAPTATGPDATPPDDDSLPTILPDVGFGGVAAGHTYQAPLLTRLKGDIQWTVDDPAKASIEPRPPIEGDAEYNSYSVITFHAAGTVHVTASSGGETGTAELGIKAYDAQALAAAEQRYLQPTDGTRADRRSCGSCHLAPDGADHSPVVLVYLSDETILRIVQTGTYDDNRSLEVPHSWNLTDLEAAGIVGYLRQLPVHPL